MAVRNVAKQIRKIGNRPLSLAKQHLKHVVPIPGVHWALQTHKGD